MRWKKLGQRLLFPHPAVLALLSLAAAGLLIYSFAALETTDLISIAAYVISFCTLVLVSLRVPDMVRWFARFRRENRYYLRYRSDVQLRINLSLYGTFFLNALYAAFQFALGVWHRSAWFYAMAGYYLLLALMRLTLMRYMRSHLPGEEEAAEWRKYRFCGWLLLAMNLALMVFTLYFVFRIRVFLHHEITTIAMAAYTFSALTIAIVNAVRYRRYGSPACSAAKAISLAAAVVSMLTLENAMLTTFHPEQSDAVLLGVSGAGVICIVQGIALHMIVNAGRKLRSIGGGEPTNSPEQAV